MTSTSAAPWRRNPSMWQVGLGLLLVATFLKSWFPGERVLPMAEAQVSNPANQRRDLVREARRTNELLTDIKRILESGELHVRVEATDNLPASGKLPRGQGQ